MRDFDERVKALAELDRIPLINALIAADADAQRIWQRGSRAKRDSRASYEAQEAKEHVARYGGSFSFSVTVSMPLDRQ